MKQVDLVRLLLQKGVVFVRHGTNHDWYKNPSTGISESSPRHREIKEQLANKDN
jgi:predicted RNA binding protein YcfA (HicA-like mRNA interferase family)